MFEFSRTAVDTTSPCGGADSDSGSDICLLIAVLEAGGSLWVFGLIYCSSSTGLVWWALGRKGLNQEGACF